MRPRIARTALTLALALTLPTLVVCQTTRIGSLQADLQPRDLTPVTRLDAPTHAPVELVRDGKPVAVVYVADPRVRENADPEIYRRKNAGTPPALPRLLHEFTEVIRIATGTTLEFVTNAPSVSQPAIVIGECEETRLAGIDATKLPAEGFVVKTASNRVFLVGGGANRGTTWAVADFLERFVGVRWYWRSEFGGRSIPHHTSLSISPAHYRDQPVFSMRFHNVDGFLPTAIHREGHNNGDQMPLPFAPGVILDKPGGTPDLPFMRHGDSLDFQTGLIQGHAGLWGGLGALNADGTRHTRWFCYSAQETLDLYLAKLKQHWGATGAVRNATHNIITESSCTVYFPNSPGLACRCPRCQATAAKFRDDRHLRATLAAEHGETRTGEIIEERAHIQVFGLFMQRLCEEVKTRWPGKKVVFRSGSMPPPDNVKFPDNFRLGAVWPGTWWSLGLEMHPSVKRTYEERIRAWGVPAVIEGSVSSPSDWAYGPVEYPHLIKDFYTRNRDCLLGSWLCIFCPKIWISSAPTYYVWQRVLWNPDLDVDATLDEMCGRLFGAGAVSARELLRLQCDRWEKTSLSRPLTVEDRHTDHLPGQSFGTGTLAQEWRLPDDLYLEIWPPDVVAQMKALRDQTLSAIEKANDTHARQAFLYWTWTFDAFLEEAATVHRLSAAHYTRDTREAPFMPADTLSPTNTLDLGHGVKMTLALLRPGSFMMGSATNTWAHHRDESPQHNIRITQPFYMGIFEVTATQYETITGTNLPARNNNQPANNISWNEATNFCRKLSAKTGRKIRLPTEAEWEYACRAGTTSLWSFGEMDQFASIGQYAWYHPAARSAQPHEVGGKQPNAWGLYDMHGNISEWCQDRYVADYYAWGPIDNPTGPETGIFRVLRGGSCHNMWARNPEFARSANRAYSHPDVRSEEIGFRVVVEPAHSSDVGVRP